MTARKKKVDEPDLPEVDVEAEYDDGPERPEPDDTPVAVPEPEPEPEQKTAGVVDDWPLPEGHYFSTPNLSRKSHSKEQRYVRQVQQEVAVEETGAFDDETRDGVLRWQEENDVTPTGVVDADVWKAMRAAR